MVDHRQLLDPMGMLSLEGTQFFSGYGVPECQGSPPRGGEDAPVVEYDEARDPPIESLEAAERVGTIAGDTRHLRVSERNASSPSAFSGASRASS